METEENDVARRLRTIEEKLESIDGKLSQKWFLPVFITVLTASLGTASFIIERNVNKADVSENKQSEVIGEFIGKSKITFYTECKTHLNGIDEQFESYCLVGQSSQVSNKIDAFLVEFRKFTLKQQVIDQNVLETMKVYSEFVSERAMDIQSGLIERSEISGVYSQSKSLLSDANKILDSEIRKFIKR